MALWILAITLGCGIGQDERPWRFQVQDSNGQPLAGHLVHVTQVSQLMFASAEDPGLCAKRVGQKVRTDSQGWIELPQGDELSYRVAFAEFEDRRGFAHEEADESLVLSSQSSVHVVVQNDGQPGANVAVGLSVDLSDSPNRTTWMLVASSRTDSHGAAELSGRLFARIFGENITVSVLGPWPDDPRSRIDPHQDRVQLELPPYGSLTVRIERLEEIERLLGGFADCPSIVVQDDPSPWSKLWGSRLEEVLSNGECRIPYIPIGVELDVSAQIERVPGPHRIVVPPFTAGETREVTIATSNVRVFRGRLVDTHGAPVSNRNFKLNGQPFTTLEDGSCVAACQVTEDQPSASIDWDGLNRLDNSGLTVPFAVVDPSSEELILDTATVEEGTGLDLLAHGRVVDTASREVTHGVVALLARDTRGYRDLVTYGAIREDGSYRVFGHRSEPPRDCELTAVALHRWAIGREPVAVDSGGRADLVVVPTGELATSSIENLELPGGLELYLRLAPADSYRSWRFHVSYNLGVHFWDTEPDSETIWRWVTPGSYSIDFFRGSYVAMQIEGIEVVAGARSRQPGLESLDLSEHVQVIEVRVESTNGIKWEPFDVDLEALHPDGQSQGFEEDRKDRGRFRGFLPVGETVQLTIEAEEHRPREVTCSGDCTIEVLPLPEVHIRLFGPQPELGEGIALGARLIKPRASHPGGFAGREGGGLPFEEPNRKTFDDRGVCAMSVEALGEYDLQWLVQGVNLSERSYKAVAYVVPQKKPRTVQIEDVEDGEVIVVAVKVPADLLNEIHRAAEKVKKELGRN